MVAIRSIFCLGLLFSVSQLKAGGGIEEMFKKLGADSNYTSPGSFNDQATGHFTGGGLVVRQKNKTVQLLSIQLPKVGMNCGDFDLSFGGFSFIQAQEMIEMFKRTASGLPTYALQLALKSTVPQIEGLMSNLREYLQKINSMMLNDCRNKQMIMEAILPNQSAMHEQVCQDMERNGGMEDWTGARRQCNQGAQQESRLKQAQKDYKDLLASDFNLVWHVLKKMDAYRNNKELAEFVMTVVGTMISRKDESSGKYILVPIEPRGDQMEFVISYLRGGGIEHLVCDGGRDGDCLKPQFKKLEISSDQSMNQRVLRKVHDLRDKYTKGDGFTPEDVSFLGDTVGIPVYKYIQISVAARQQFFMNGVSEFIALSVLLHQFESITDEILQALAVIETAQIDSKVIKEFRNRLLITKSNLQQLLGRTDRQAVWQLTQEIRAAEHV